MKNSQINLLQSALRIQPNKIIFGELRGSETDNYIKKRGEFTMRNSKIKWVAIVASAFLFTGCVSDMQAIVADGTVSRTTDQQFKATNPAKVKLYYGATPRHPNVIGHVRVDNYSMIATPHTQSHIDEELKKQAASIGGNGVINIQSNMDKTTGDVIKK